ncbi:hypothetical protein ACF1BP_36840 [Streptomyces sp. NPDC014735]|uniref:hypothetical protein n=1 Tax=unclassified Streptomyces TaxID=2593676 RepID=UPI000A97C084|nr:hypothetical protein [Streptomyces sp. CB01580]
MPLVEVTYAPTVPEPRLRELGSMLPHLVSLAVECPEEPYDNEPSAPTTPRVQPQ